MSAAVQPEISILLPFRDVAATLERAARSVLDDEGRALELVLVDDGARDESSAIAARLAAIDPRVRVVAGPGHGVAAALNAGLVLCRAPLVARMDGDDESLPGRLAAQARALEDDASLAAVGGRVEAFSDETLGEGLVRYVDWMNSLRTPEEHARDVFVEAPLCHPSVMLRRSVLEAQGGWHDGDFAEDWDLWLRLVAAGHRLGKIDRLVLRWRHRAGRATFTDPRYAPERHRALRARHLAPELARQREAGRALACWGAGPTGRRLARALEAEGVRFSSFVDIDPRKIGRTARGAPILGEPDLGAEDFVVVAVGSRHARELVREALLRTGRVERRDFVCAA